MDNKIKMSEFDRSVISSLNKSLGFFVRSLVLACNTLMKGVNFSDKPEYVLKTENFAEFFENVLKEQGAVEKFREKVLKDVYDANYTDITAKIMPGGDKINDQFMLDQLEFTFGKFVLPVSTIYGKITEFAKNYKGRCIHPPKILLGFFAVMYHTVIKDEPKETLDLISANINVMIDAVEDMARPPTPPSSNFLMDAISKINPGQAGDLFNKIGNDPRMSEEFKKVHSKVTEVFKSDNPMEGLSSLFKEISAQAAEEGVSIPGIPSVPEPGEGSEEQS